jgi:hypothetical protein
MTVDELLLAIRGTNVNALRKLVVRAWPALSKKERAAVLIRATLGPDNWDVRPVGWLVHYCLDHGADPNTASDGKQTYPYPRGIPLAHVLIRAMQHPNGIKSPAKVQAANKEIEAAAIAFVMFGADLGPLKQSGETLLHGAARYATHTLLEICIERGAVVDARNKRGETPLFEAARADSVAALKRLVAAGATNVRNKHDETAHDIAVAQGAEQAARYLAAHFRSETPTAGGALSSSDVKRLLGRLAKVRHSIYSPSGAPDPALLKVLARSRVREQRSSSGARFFSVELELDTKALPPLSPTLRKELLTALGHEGLRWLRAARVETRAFGVGVVKPTYGIDARSVKRAEKLLARISGHRN